MSDNSDYPTRGVCSDLQKQVDAVRTVAKLAPGVRLYWGDGTERIYPHMPEDDAAIVRSFAAHFDRGDTLARDLAALHARVNEAGRAWFDGELTAAEALQQLGDDMPGSSAVYEWQKSRERLEWVAQNA